MHSQYFTYTQITIFSLSPFSTIFWYTPGWGIIIIEKWNYCKSCLKCSMLHFLNDSEEITSYTWLDLREILCQNNLKISSEVKTHNKGSLGMPIVVRWHLVVMWVHFSLLMALTVFATLYLVYLCLVLRHFMNVINPLLLSTWIGNNENSCMQKNRNKRNLCNEKKMLYRSIWSWKTKITECIKCAMPTTYIARNEGRRPV